MMLVPEFLSQSGWLGIVLMAVFWFGVISLVVWLTGNASKWLRSITVIKTVHTIVFVLLSGLLGLFLYEITVDRISAFTWIAVTLFLAEGVILLLNGGRCPLTTYAEQLGSSHGQITDLFLPKWFADRVFTVYTVLFVGGLLLLVLRLLR